MAFDKGPRNTAPGTHGLLHEFYIHFWYVIKTDLLTTHNSILRNRFPPSAKVWQDCLCAVVSGTA
jgi:hypothetical protein